MFLFKTAICILELFGEIMLSLSYNVVRHEEQGVTQKIVANFGWILLSKF